MKKIQWMLVLGLVVCLGVPRMSFGQATTASITGEVRDTTGGVILGATVTVTNVETGIIRSVSTDQMGRYRAPNLAVGGYQVEAAFPGFKTITRRGITLTIGRDAVVDMTMEVGDVTERVEVTGEAPLVETSNAVLGGLVEQRTIQDIPLNGRSFLELATLQAGTVVAATGGQSVSQGHGQKVSISGGRFTSNLYLIDGTMMNDSFNSAGGTAGGVAAGVETVREFKVITNSYSAEYGQHTGGVINAVTRGGTNEFHGSVYEFLRNDNLDAYRWEDKARVSEPVKPEFRRNQFGVAIGGPIQRDRTFFFGNYEALREDIGDNRRISIPDARTRLGFLPAKEVINPSVYPEGSNPDEVNVAAVFPSQFAKVKPFFDKLWPIPSNVTLRQQTDGTLDYDRTTSQPTNLDFLSARVDHQLSDNDSLFFRYTIDHAERERVGSINVIGNDRTRNQFITLQHDRIVSPTVLNSLNLGFTRTLTHFESQTREGAVRVSFTDSDLGHGAVGVGGISGTGSGAVDPRTFIKNNWQAKNDLMITRGNHTFKIGANFSRLQHNDTSPRQPAGDFDFESLEDFLQDEPEQANISLAKNFVRHIRQSVFGAYFQDDWKLTRNFTLNWGVRYEMTTSPRFAADLKGKMPRALEDKFFALDADGDNLFSVADIVQGDTLFENPSKDNFVPRLGFAWDLFGDGMTSLRGGAGIFTESLVFWTYRMATLHTAPLFVEGRLSDGDIEEEDGFEAEVDFPDAFFTQRDAFAARALRYEGFQAKPNQPYVGKFSLEIQRQITPTTLFRVGYSGTRGVHFPNRQEQNSRRATTLDDGRIFFIQDLPRSQRENNPNFGRARHRRTNGTSDYHSLRLGVEKRLSHGLQFQGNYTWSKNIDEGTSVTGGTDFAGDPSARHWSLKDRGLSNLDVRHAFTLNTTYELPGANLTGWMGQVLGGWQVSGLLRLSSGLPFSAQTGFDWARQIQGGRYPDLIAGESTNPTGGSSGGCALQGDSDFRFVGSSAIPSGAALGTPDLYYDPCIWELPTPRGVVGNIGRNTLIGPGNANMDFRVAKTFNLSKVNENLRLEFRGELFNSFNHPNFGQPSSNVFHSGTRRPRTESGMINSTRGSPRKIQLGLKLIF